MKIIIYLCVLFLGLSSCKTSSAFTTADGQKFKPTSASEIKTFVDPPSAEFQVIGPVIAVAESGSTSEHSVNLLKKTAAKIGADAIVNLKLEIDYGYWAPGIKSSGIAIKFINK